MNNSQNHLQNIRMRQGRRMKIAGVFICLCLAGLYSAAAYLVYTKGEEYSAASVRQQITGRGSSANRVTRPNRGNILDRNKNTLAESTRVYNVILDVTVLDSREPNTQNPEDDDKNRTLKVLNEVLHIPMTELEALFAKNADGELAKPTNYYIAARKVSSAVVADIRQHELPDVWFEDDTQRKYTDPFLAPQTVGFLRGDAAWGLEGYYNTDLMGVEGRTHRTYDLENNPRLEENPVQNGYSLITTLDAGIQRIAQSIAQEAYETYPCQFTGVLVMNPYTAEIYAMAQYPTFSLESPDDPLLYTNQNLSNIWEALSAEQQ
jgi:cell division protein FtsI/penicillin-binding protein 2